MHVQMKFRKFENCTFCDITSSNVHGFSSNLQNRRSLSRWFSWGVETLCSHQNYTCEIWSKLKKQNISLNFWVNIGVWPIVSMRLAMPNTTVMSEYTIYMVWKLIAMFCPITCVMFIWQFQKLVVTGQLKNADIHVQMKFWKFENCTFCDITSSNVHGFSSHLQNTCSLSRRF